MKPVIIVTLILATFSGTALASGAQLFRDKACWSCHGKDGKTPLMPGYPRIAGQDAQYIEKQILDIKSGARANGNSAAMKLMLNIVSNDEIKEIANYVSKLER